MAQRFKYIEGPLAHFIEELSQYNFKILNRKGISHESADALSRIRDPLQECDCYRSGLSVQDLPCGCCAYCRRAHRQWARFNEDVGDVVPLAVRTIGRDTMHSNSLPQGIQGASKYQTSREHQNLGKYPTYRELLTGQTVCHPSS